MRWLQVQEADLLQVMEIGRVSNTRLSCQAKQFNVILEHLAIIMEVLQM